MFSTRPVLPMLPGNWGRGISNRFVLTGSLLWRAFMGEGAC
jgi:hypothetical protein